MVNHGASRGCSNCRKRKIACDKTRPLCRNCSNTGRECSGYESDSSGLIFRHQDLSVVKGRSKDDAREKVLQISPQMFALLNKIDFRATPMQLSHNIKDLSVAFLFHVFLGRYSPVRGELGTYLGQLGGLFSSTPIDSALHASTEALGLSIMAKFNPTIPSIVNDSRAQYARSLARIRTGLEDPEEARSDGMLMSIMISSLYEMMTVDTFSMETYMSHLKGALALLRLRGMNVLDSPDALRIFRAVRFQILQRYITESIEPDRFTSDLDWTFDSLRAKDNHAWIPSSIAIKVAKLRAAFKSLPLQDMKGHERQTALLEAFRDATILDQQIARTIDGLPSRWSVAGVTSSNLEYTEEVSECVKPYPGPIHSYQSLFWGFSYNAYRALRLRVLQVVYECLRLLNGHLDEVNLSGQELIYKRNAQSLVNDICASVPFHLGFRDDQHYLFGNWQNTTVERQAIKGLGAYYLLQSLWTARSIPVISNAQREWLGRCMNHLSSEFGIAQASFLAGRPTGSIRADVACYADPLGLA